MDLKNFLNAFKAKNSLTKEARFGVMFYHNDPKKKALLVLNNRDTLFTDIVVRVISPTNQIHSKKIDQMEAKAALHVGFDELRDSNQMPFEGIIKEVYIIHGSKQFFFIAKDKGFIYKGSK